MEKGKARVSRPSVRPLGPILAATIATTDLGRAVAAYGAGLGFRPVADGTVPAALARAWGAADLAGARWSLLAPDGQASPGALRLVTVPGPRRDARPLSSLGWAAAELSVADPDSLIPDLEGAGFRVLGPCRPLGSNPAIRAMQVAGPDGEVLYLTDIRAYDGALDLYRAERPVDRCFIAVLAAPDLDAARGWYEARFSVDRVSDRQVPVPVLTSAWGQGSDQAVRISSLQLAGGCLIETDGYPSETPPRPRSGGLPLGIAAMSFLTDGAGGTPIDMPPYDGRPVAVHRGAAGELIELVGAATRHGTHHGAAHSDLP